MTNFWGAVTRIAYSHTKSQAVWPSLAHQAPIPDACHSRLKDTDQPSVVGLGVVVGICALLRGEVFLSQAADEVTVCYMSTAASSATRRRMRAHLARPSGLHLQGGVGRTGPFVLAVATAVLAQPPALQEITERWWALIGELTRVRGARTTAEPSFSAADLRHASNDPQATQALMALVDSVYYGLKAVYMAGDLTHEDSEPPAPITEEPLGRLTVLGVPAPSGGRTLVPGNTITEQLQRAARRGGRVLLVGPTGTFKTETAKATAVALARPMFVVKGSPDMEDRDFLGGYQMLDGAPQWVDGPFTQAFVRAQQEGVVLLFDELLRTDPINLSSAVGYLDHVSAQEAALMGVSGLPDGRYYVLRLKNGELVWAPVVNVLLIATTNLGDGYLQAGQGIDSALLGRFSRIIDMEYAEADVALALYGRLFGDAALVASAYAVELDTRENHVSRSGLLEREANPRVVISWLELVQALMEDGWPRHEAFRLAAESTLMPFCVARD
ncbi:AAA family ATPase, partial [Deinococcus sp. HMF7604]